MVDAPSVCSHPKYVLAALQQSCNAYVGQEVLFLPLSNEIKAVVGAESGALFGMAYADKAVRQCPWSGFKAVLCVKTQYALVGLRPDRTFVVGYK